jgi:hypothetical protein
VDNLLLLILRKASSIQHMTDVAKIKLSKVLHTALRGVMLLGEDPASRDMIIRGGGGGTDTEEEDGNVTNVQCLLLILLRWKEDEFVVSSVLNTLVFFTRSREGRRQLLQRDGGISIFLSFLPVHFFSPVFLYRYFCLSFLSYQSTCCAACVRMSAKSKCWPH